MSIHKSNESIFTLRKYTDNEILMQYHRLRSSQRGCLGIFLERDRWSCQRWFYGDASGIYPLLDTSYHAFGVHSCYIWRCANIIFYTKPGLYGRTGASLDCSPIYLRYPSTNCIFCYCIGLSWITRLHQPKSKSMWG